MPRKRRYLILALLAGACFFAASGCDKAREGLEELREVRASLRAYDGAPPVIPHEVATNLYRRCLYCHKTGKNLGDDTAKATPHPEMKNCLQCHVEQITDDLFMKNDFEPFRIRGSLPGKNPAGPPRITHRLQLRENCEACHLSESAPEAIKPRHGARPHCVQCHVHVELPEKDFP